MAGTENGKARQKLDGKCKVQQRLQIPRWGSAKMYNGFYNDHAKLIITLCIYQMKYSADHFSHFL